MMIRGNSRSGEKEKNQKGHHRFNLISRTVSAAKLCKGDAVGSQVDDTALKSLIRNPSDLSGLSKSRARGVVKQQQLQMEAMEDELRASREELDVCEMEKYRLLDQLQEAKDASISVIRAKHELLLEIQRLKTSEKTKDEKIKSLALAVVEREKHLTLLHSENDKRIRELEREVENQKQMQLGIADSLAQEKKQHDATKSALEESRNEIAALLAKSDSFSESDISGDGSPSEEEIRILRNELKAVKRSLARAEEEEQRIKNEWNQAIQAEEKSTKAMEDLAFALKEVATESYLAKEKLKATNDELESARSELHKLKERLRSTEERYQKLLNETKQQAELNKNVADRLRLEADETLLAWNEKEVGFVSCIKRAEEEKAMAQNESRKLAESLRAAENMTIYVREETFKLRDILKQAINEANAAKAAAGIARDENSFLKDCLADKEESLLLLTKENERYRVSVAAAQENAKQLKILLSSVSSDCKDKSQSELLMYDVDEEDPGISMNKTFSFTLEDLRFLNDAEDEIILHEDPVKAAALKGSIFDANAETPKSEPRTPQSIFTHHQRRHSYAITDGGMTPNSEDFDSGHDDSDSDKHSHRRMKKTMFRRVGDLLTIKRGFHKKDPSIDSLMTAHAQAHAHAPLDK